MHYIKKLSLIALLSFSQFLSADSNIIAEQHIGYSHLSLDDNTGNGFNFGFNFAVPLGESANTDGFNLGLGIEIESSSIDFPNNENSSILGTTGNMFLGYNYGDFNIRAGGGYTYLDVDKEYYIDGAVFTSSAGWNFSKSFGIQVTYKTGNLSSNYKEDINTQLIGINLVFHN